MTLRLLHVIGSVDPKTGGPIEGVLQQSSERIKLGWSMEIVSMDPPDAPYLQNFPMHVHAMGPRGGWPRDWRRKLPWVHYRVAPDMREWIAANRNRFDLIVVHGLWNYSAFAARQALADSRTPYVVFTHGMLDPWFRKRYPLKGAAKQLSWWLCEGQLLERAKFVLFTTEEERIQSRNVFWPYRVQERVVRYGIADVPLASPMQLDAFRAKVPGLEGRPYLLFLSRIHPKKGCDLLIGAFAQVAAQHPDLQLVMAGPDHSALRSQLEAMLPDPALRQRIHWPGMLDGAAKWGAYYGAEAFALISHQENFGIVVAEAAACSTPILISNKVNIWREVAACQAGLVVNDDAAGALDCVQQFLALSPAERRRMGERARALFSSTFDVTVTQASIDDAFIEASRMTESFTGLVARAP